MHTFSRKYPIFFLADIVRFWYKNLDEQKQWEVFVFFLLRQAEHRHQVRLGLLGRVVDPQGKFGTALPHHRP